MVCIRCKMVVKSELEKLGVQYSTIDLGEVEITESIPKDKLEIFSAALKQTGLELLDDTKKSMLRRLKRLLLN
jgi:hypothetical protein